MGFDQLMAEAEEYLPSEKLAVLGLAYRFAEECHRGQLRASGGSYVEHSVETARVVASLRLDASSIAAALLHDVVEDCDVSLSQLEGRFGSEIRRLVDGVTKLSALSWAAFGESKKEQSQAENLMISLPNLSSS